MNAAPQEKPKPVTTAQAALKKPRPLPVRANKHYHNTRRTVQLTCFLVFLSLPFLNLMRFDIPRQRFFFLGYELWINEFAILFFSLMFTLFVVAAASMLYGRMYCGYFCPQMIFSEASLALEERLQRFINKRLIKWPKERRQAVSRSLFYVALGVAAVFLAFVFIAYFVEPRDLLQRLLSFDIKTYGGIAGATTTLLTFLDFAFVRTRFCTTVCPYGYLQGMLGDQQTLIVEYRDPQHACIECKKCVRVCHMGIDIRHSPYQIECIHCGECIDACNDVLGRLGKEGLIHYAWGEQGELLEKPQTHVSFLRRFGLRDAKRGAVLLVILFYAIGLATALALRHNVLVRVAPVRATLYRVNEDGRISNQFRLTIANRQSKPAAVTLSLHNLPAAQLQLAQPLELHPGEVVQREFEIVAPAGGLPAGVNHFALVSQVQPNDETQHFELTFITPTQKEP